MSRHHSARTRAPRTSAVTVTVAAVNHWTINVIEQLEHRRLLSAAASAQHHAVPGTGPGFAQPIAKYFDPKTHGPRATPLGNPTPFGLSPAQVRHAYGIDTITFSSGTITGDGSGQTVAIIDAFDDPKFSSSGTAGYNTSDLFFFNQQYGLPQFGGAGNPTFTKLNQSGGTSYPVVDNNWAGEIALDVEWVHAIAPKANIVLIEANDNSFGNLITNSVATARTITGVTAITMSFGSGEFAGETTFDGSFFTPGGHANITYLAASGDAGANGSYPGYSPNVVSVGGTNLSITAQNVWSAEVGWSGSGGGISTQESKPAYQSTVTQSASFRTNPDIAIVGGPNSAVSVYDTQNNLSSAPWTAYYGTSLSSPVWAGITAVANQGRAINGLATFTSSTLLTKLYQVNATDFHDITSGNNGFAAVAGYDLVTGRGTPKVDVLMPDLIGTPSAPAAPSAPDLADASDSGNSNTDNLTNVNLPTFTGTAVASTTVKLFDGVTQIGTTTASAGGTWSITVASALSEGSHTITATATNANGTSPLSGTLSITIDTAPPAVPTTPDMVAASDTGRTNSDNVTAVASPTFTGTTESNARVQLLVDGVNSSAASANVGGTFTFAALAMSNGTHAVRATAGDAAGNVSAQSAALSVTIDTVKPTAQAAVFNYLTAQSLVYTFSEDVAWSINGGSLQLDNLTTATTLDSGTFAEAYNSGAGTATYTFAGQPSAVLPDGSYQATLSGVRDAAGNAIASNPSDAFFVLAGDANRSRSVDLTDFTILAGNFNTTGKNFSQGNFDYDAGGHVDLTDFTILASRFNTTLPAPAAATAVMTVQSAAPNPAPAVMQTIAADLFSDKPLSLVNGVL